MSKNSQDSIVMLEKHGLPVYAENPSVPNVEGIRKQRPARIGNDQKGFIVDGGTGEVLSTGSIGFYEFEEVDDTRFVKMFLAGIKQAASLTKAGLSVFEVVYEKVQENPKRDEIKLSAEDTDLKPVTYRRGLRELLEKEFLYLTRYPGVFFVNIRYMFNGDRLAFVKGYQRKGSQKQHDLPLLEEGDDE
ncbi:MAG: hypothetical protein F6K62_11205 [Sphaerospermopsis sp. SIO1G2]|nr:hypothetical protein [Sphaerospermopsis sp. SIO1G2]